MSRIKILASSALGTGLVALALAASACAKCGNAADGAAPSTAAGPVKEALHSAILDEFKAEATYRSVIQDFGDVRPFSNIIHAERRHAQRLAMLFEERGWSVPSNPWTDSREPVPRFDSVTRACVASVVAEQDNIELYDRLLEQDLPRDVERVFRALQDASRSRHLPAFQRCSR